MTIPASGPISLTDVMNELRTSNAGRAYPISLGDSDVRALAGLPSGPISLGDLRGKSSYTPMTVTGHNADGTAFTTNGSGTASCSPSVTVTGGTDPKSYSWSFTSNPDGCTLSSATLSACSVRHSYVKNQTGSLSATLQCQVSDGTATETASNIIATLNLEP